MEKSPPSSPVLSESSSSSDKKPFRKIIVAVHGIGKQSRNSTIRSVTLMAAQNLPDRPGDVSSAYPLGYFYSTEVDSAVNVSPFDEIDGKDELREVGFAEVFWADIPEGVVTESRTMEESKEWARTVVARAQRLYERNYPDPAVAQGKEKLVPPDFGLAAEVLDEIIDTVYVLENLSWLAEKAGVMSFDVREVMDEYLGDVQLVAEFSYYRNDIVGRFHRAMEKIHKDYPEADIHVVAHSEGSVVAFLGLLNALLRNRVNPAERKDGRIAKGPEVESLSEIPLKWLAKVKGLMTIGSPIDKHYLLWPKLFECFDLEKTQELIDAQVLKENQIKWRNYYDLADPVGYKLDTIRRWLEGGGKRPVSKRPKENSGDLPELAKRARKALTKLGAGKMQVANDGQPDYCQDQERLCKLFEFESNHDIGFTRYLFPGKAHNDYWDDAELFSHFIDDVVKAKTNGANKAAKPGNRRGVGTVSRCLPFLLSAVLLCAASYILLRGILSFYIPAVEPIDHYMRLMVMGYSSTAMEYSWFGVLKEFGGWALMLAGTTIGARVHRLGGLRRLWWPLSIAMIVTGAYLVDGRMIRSFAGNDAVPGEQKHLLIVLLTGLCILVMAGSDWLGMRKTRRRRNPRVRCNDDARERRLRWIRKGARPLVLLGALATLVLAILPSLGDVRLDRENLGKAISAKFLFHLYDQSADAKVVEPDAHPQQPAPRPKPSEAEGKALIQALKPWLKFARSPEVTEEERKKQEIRWAEKIFSAAARARSTEAMDKKTAVEEVPLQPDASRKVEVIKKVAEDYENIAKVLQVTPPVWPLVFSWLVFCYLWWLSILIFDLAYVWHRYVRRGAAIERLGRWMDKDWKHRLKAGG